MKEVTPEDIKNIFMEKEIPLLDGLVSPCIETINQILVDKYKVIISSGYLNILRSDLNLPKGFRATDTSWELLGDCLGKFFKSWDIASGCENKGRYFQFMPKEPIVIEMAPTAEQKKDIPLITTEPVESRFDILDI